MRLLESILTLDWQALREIDFESIEIQVSAQELHSIIVDKSLEDNINPVFSFKIDDTKFSGIHIYDLIEMRFY